MKNLLTALLILFSFHIFSQENTFLLKGRVLDPLSDPVGNAYIIIFRTLSAYATNNKGEFTVPVTENDSILVNHLSFLPKKISIGTVLDYPDIYLEYDTFLIKEVVIIPGPDRDSTALDKTMKQIRNADIRIYKRMNPDLNRVQQSVIENNIVFRSQAASVSLFSFSPLSVIQSINNQKKRKKETKGYRFYRNKEQMLRKERKKNQKLITDSVTSINQ